MIAQLRSLWQAARVRGRRHPLTTLLVATIVLMVTSATTAIAASGGDSGGNLGFWSNLAVAARERHHDLTGCYPPPADGSLPRSCAPSPTFTPATGSRPTTGSSTPAQGGRTPARGGKAATVAHGWSSGASGPEARDGSFGTWRGSPMTIIGTWADVDATAQEEMYGLVELSEWNGDIDIAIGGTDLESSDENYRRAAAGAYLARWKRQAAALQHARAGKSGIAYVRPFHEFNGDWYQGWQVTPKNLADYKAAFTLLAKTIRDACPITCKIVWSPNNDTSPGSASVAAAYPGAAVVDVIGVDYYNANGNVVANSPHAWIQAREAGTAWDPVGPEKWRQFALARGKPLAFPEWALRHEEGGGDDVEFIRGMHEFMSAHAAHPGDSDVAGKVIYDVYFNIAMDSDQFLIMNGPNVKASAQYRRLHWGTATFLS